MYNICTKFADESIFHSCVINTSTFGQFFARHHHLTSSSERKVGRIINPNRLRMIITLTLINNPN